MLILDELDMLLPVETKYGPNAAKRKKKVMHHLGICPSALSLSSRPRLSKRFHSSSSACDHSRGPAGKTYLRKDYPITILHIIVRFRQASLDTRNRRQRKKENKKMMSLPAEELVRVVLETNNASDLQVFAGFADWPSTQSSMVVVLQFWLSASVRTKMEWQAAVR